MTNTSNSPSTDLVGNKATIGVVLLNMGGPVSTADCKSFLYKLFSDPNIIRLGGGFIQKLLARFISTRRAAGAAKRYSLISQCQTACKGSKHCPNHTGSSTACSPINPITEQQRIALEHYLNGMEASRHTKVYTAMRYGYPDTETTLKEVVQDEIEQVVLLPLYPHYSSTTTASSQIAWSTAWNAHTKHAKLTNNYLIPHYHTHPLYIRAVNEKINETLGHFPEQLRASVHLLFSAHGTPMAEVERGDPYTLQIQETVSEIMALKDRNETYSLGYQSKVGPAKWTEPNTIALARKIVSEGTKHILVIPISFVSDHIETLVELDIELREELKDLPVEDMQIMAALNDSPKYIEALAALVNDTLKEGPPKTDKSLSELTLSK